MSRTLVLGLGNPILTDDGVGIRVARTLQTELDGRPEITVAEASVGGLRLLEIVSGFERVILVDAIQTREGRPGDIYRLTLDAFCASMHSGCSHDLDLFTALEFGRQLGMPMPHEIVIIAVEVADVLTFGEEPTPAVRAAIPRAVEIVRQELAQAP